MKEKLILILAMVLQGAAFSVLAAPLAVTNMALIPAGSFTMGDTFGGGPSNELPVHKVYVSAFYMDRYDVTKALWDSVHLWATNHGYSFDNAGSGKAPNHPVETVNWYDAVKWCNARSEKEGLTPCYYTSTNQTMVYQSGQLDLADACVKWTANGYRLPTEAEWEKAARGGASGHRYPWTNADIISQSQANYYSATQYSYNISTTQGYHPAFYDGVYPFTSPVGYFAPNGYGLYDMAGNLWQWCWDWYDVSWYKQLGATQQDTHGPEASPKAYGFRVMRGGAWHRSANFARCSHRGGDAPDLGWIVFGFRCVRAP